MSKETPASTVEKQMRVDEVKSLIVKGVIQRDIVRYCEEKHPEWGVDKRQLRNYVYEAHEQLRRDAVSIDFAKELAIAKARNELAMQLALKIQDIKTFASINKQNADLLNLRNLRYEPEWIETARAAGYDPDELVNAFWGGEKDVMVVNDMEVFPNGEENEQSRLDG